MSSDHREVVLAAALAAYPDAKVDVDEGGMILHPSRPPVAPRLVAQPRLSVNRPRTDIAPQASRDAVIVIYVGQNFVGRLTACLADEALPLDVQPSGRGLKAAVPNLDGFGAVPHRHHAKAAGPARENGIAKRPARHTHLDQIAARVMDQFGWPGHKMRQAQPSTPRIA